MDGENNGNPYEQMDDLGGKTHHFRKHLCITSSSPSVEMDLLSTPQGA